PNDINDNKSLLEAPMLMDNCTNSTFIASRGMVFITMVFIAIAFITMVFSTSQHSAHISN
ncbi:hypothetical protein DBO95_28850, partial [Yersinia pestis]